MVPVSAISVVPWSRCPVVRFSAFQPFSVSACSALRASQSPSGTTDHSPAIHRWDHGPPEPQPQRGERNHGPTANVLEILPSLRDSWRAARQTQRSIAGLLSSALRAAVRQFRVPCSALRASISPVVLWSCLSLFQNFRISAFQHFSIPAPFPDSTTDLWQLR